MVKTMDEALAWLREQSITRGLGGRLEDFDIARSEDGRTISIWAFYSFDAPLMASVAAAAADGDLAAYYAGGRTLCSRTIVAAIDVHRRNQNVESRARLRLHRSRRW